MSSDKVWTTREGSHLPINKLSDSHLLNIIQFLRCRAGSMRSKAIDRAMDNAAICAGYNGNGEQAQMAAEQEMTAAFDEGQWYQHVATDNEVLTKTIPAWKDLLKEVSIRKLMELGL